MAQGLARLKGSLLVLSEAVKVQAKVPLTAKSLERLMDRPSVRSLELLMAAKWDSPMVDSTAAMLGWRLG